MKLAWSILAFTHADVWHGEEDIATLDNIGGGEFGAQNTGIENLFDDDFDSIFASDPDMNDNSDKHLLVTFNVSLLTLKASTGVFLK